MGLDAFNADKLLDFVTILFEFCKLFYLGFQSLDLICEFAIGYHIFVECILQVTIEFKYIKPFHMSLCPLRLVAGIDLIMLQAECINLLFNLLQH